MINNFNTYSPRMGQMASSSMFFNQQNQEVKQNNAFIYKNNTSDFKPHPF